MSDKEYMSGAQLRQYLHISTRKMKYLMDYNYIPHENTGLTTHKYRVLVEDAVKFKHRMDNEVGFLSEIEGHFSNRIKKPKKPRIIPTEEFCKAFKKWLKALWAELPDALPVQTASKLVGYKPQRIHELIRNKELCGVTLGKTEYCIKKEFISYMALPYKLSNPKTEQYKKLINDFQKYYKKHKPK